MDSYDGLTMDDWQLSLGVIAERCELFGAARPVASRCADGSLARTTMAACARRARRLGGALRALGIGEGDRVATLLWNQPEHLELYLAVPSMGAVLHPLNPRLAPRELSWAAADAADRALVVDESLLDVARGLSWAFEHVIVVRHHRRSRCAEARAGELDYASLVASAPPMSWPEVPERRAAMICHTSGTTGNPKGVVYSHRALMLHCLVAGLPDVLGVGCRDVVMPLVPMFHANAWGLPHAAALAGAALVLPGRHLDAVSVLDLLAGERVTLAAGVPTAWMAVLDALDAEPGRWDLRALRRVRLGGSAPPESLLERFDRHGIAVDQGWGMTETGPLGTVCMLPPALDDASGAARRAYRLRQGAAIPLIQLRARGEDGALVPWDDRTPGELEVRGPWVAAGYIGGRDADRFTGDGWFCTGDIVRIDRFGAIRICDRAKDMIRSGGEWISSVALENHLMSHDAVAQAAVVGVPDERWGERPLAAVVVRQGRQIDAAALREHLARRFAGWQLPDRIEFVTSIPQSATGKFKKTDLRVRFSSRARAR